MRTIDLRDWGGWLVELAWELNELGVDSVVRLSPDQQPSMEIFLPPRQTTQQDRVWVGTWEQGCGRGTRTRARMVCERITRRAR
ncbi:hypothetical protein [Streptosporangium sp. NPDC006930]|uniref:hypothetical protein n=1 Tax=Streptosporangium sp. NPDC006930 TaxID=3154783 RepID=UPI00343B0CAA